MRLKFVLFFKFYYKILKEKSQKWVLEHKLQALFLVLILFDELDLFAILDLMKKEHDICRHNVT